MIRQFLIAMMLGIASAMAVSAALVVGVILAGWLA